MMRGDQRGFALVAVLLVLALLGIAGAEFAYSMRLEATAVRAWKEDIAAAHLAEAAVEQAVREIVAEAAVYAVVAESPSSSADAGDCDLTFYSRERAPVPRLPRSQVPLGGGHFSYRLSDEEARLNLNTASPDRIDRLLQALGLDKSARDTVVDSLQDWRDANEEHRLNGAESDDHYLKLPVPYRAKNRNLDSVNELLQIRGVTPALLHGADRHAPPSSRACHPSGLADLVTVKTPGQQINLNTAPPLVLRALGLADAEISEIQQSRRDGPYPNLGRFGGRGFALTSRTFRVEAEGLVDGRVRARVTAIVQKRSEAGRAGIAILEWSGLR
jgi:general secretion pathway protein K